jgi:hypothetical protein
LCDQELPLCAVTKILEYDININIVAMSKICEFLKNVEEQQNKKIKKDGITQQF